MTEEYGATYVSFNELLRMSDVISVHTPLSPQTRHLISDNEFAKMRKGVFIVNTSRGAGPSVPCSDPDTLNLTYPAFVQ